jgi:hypothetical protein
MATRNPRRAYDAEIAPMTIAQMRAWGVERVIAYCHRIGCGHYAIFSAEDLPESLPVPDAGLGAETPSGGRSQTLVNSIR